MTLPSSENALGTHVLVDFFDCNVKFLNDRKIIEDCLSEAAIICGATIVEKVIHQFNPHGISGVIVIAESHITIHTWPENNFVAIDLFTCGDCLNADKAISYLKNTFNAKDLKTQNIKRGLFSEIDKANNKG